MSYFIFGMGLSTYCPTSWPNIIAIRTTKRCYPSEVLPLEASTTPEKITWRKCILSFGIVLDVFDLVQSLWGWEGFRNDPEQYGFVQT